MPEFIQVPTPLGVEHGASDQVAHYGGFTSLALTLLLWAKHLGLLDWLRGKDRAAPDLTAQLEAANAKLAELGGLARDTAGAVDRLATATEKADDQLSERVSAISSAVQEARGRLTNVEATCQRIDKRTEDLAVKIGGST